MTIAKSSTADLAEARRGWRAKKVELIEKFARLAELGCDQAEALLRKGDASQARNAAVMAAVAYDKAALAAGDVTSRSEELSANVNVDTEAVLNLLREVSGRSAARQAVREPIEARSVVAKPVDIEPAVLESEPVDPHAGQHFDVRFGWVDDAPPVAK